MTYLAFLSAEINDAGYAAAPFRTANNATRTLSPVFLLYPIDIT